MIWMKGFSIFCFLYSLSSFLPCMLIHNQLLLLIISLLLGNCNQAWCKWGCSVNPHCLASTEKHRWIPFPQPLLFFPQLQLPRTRWGVQLSEDLSNWQPKLPDSLVSVLLYKPPAHGYPRHRLPMSQPPCQPAVWACCSWWLRALPVDVLGFA